MTHAPKPTRLALTAKSRSGPNFSGKEATKLTRCHVWKWVMCEEDLNRMR